MKEFFDQLNSRERIFVVTGAAVTLVAIVYFLGWAPLSNGVADLESSITEQKELVGWMRGAAAQVKQLRTVQAGKGASLQGQSILTVVDRTARSSRLGRALKRVEPEGTTAVRVWLEQAAFDEVIRWLAALHDNYGINVARVSFDRQALPGLVNASLRLERGA